MRRVRFWLDQCIELGNRGQGPLMNVRILPYTVWPVLSLRVKRSHDTDRTTASEQHYRIFLVELAGLWGAGLIMPADSTTLRARRTPTRFWPIALRDAPSTLERSNVHMAPFLRALSSVIRICVGTMLFR